MDKKHFLGIMISLLILIFACAPQQTEQPALKVPVPEAKDVVEKVVVEQPKGNPVIGIVSPKDGDLIKSSRVTVQVL